MPSAEDKVVLKVQLDIAEARKGFKDLQKDFTKFQRTATKGGAGATNRDLRKQVRELRELCQSYQNLGKCAAGATRVQQQEAGKAIKSHRAQQAEIAKTGKMLDRMKSSLKGVGRTGIEAARGVAAPVARAAGGTARVGMGAGMGVMNFLMGGLQNAFQAYMQHGIAQFGMTGMGTQSQVGFGKAMGRGPGGVGGGRLGYTPMETAMHGSMVGRQAGAPGASYRAQQFGIAGGGMDIGQAAGVMGALRQAGVTFGGSGWEKGSLADKDGMTSTGLAVQAREKAGAGQLAALIKGAMKSGIDKSRMFEYFQGVARLTGMQGGRQTGNVDVTGIGAGLAQIMQIPGMAGQRGIQLAQNLDQGIRAPGAGEAGQALILQSMGFGKPGGKTGYYDALKRQQRGFAGDKGAQNVIDVLKEVTSQFGVTGVGGSDPRMQEANIALTQTIPGLTLDLAEGIQDIYNSGVSQEEKLKKIKDKMEEAQGGKGTLEKQTLAAIKGGFAGEKTHLAKIQAELIKMGGGAAKPVMKMQKDMLKMQTAMWPALLEVLKNLSATLTILAPAVEKMAAWLGKMLGGGPSPAVQAKAKTAEIQKFEKAQKEVLAKTMQGVDTSTGAGYLRKAQAVHDYQSAMLGKGVPMKGASAESQKQLKDAIDVAKAHGIGGKEVGSGIRKAFGDLANWEQKEKGPAYNVVQQALVDAIKAANPRSATVQPAGGPSAAAPVSGASTAAGAESLASMMAAFGFTPDLLAKQVKLAAGSGSPTESRNVFPVGEIGPKTATTPSGITSG